jgi:flagellar biosynthetic protein FlhB
VSDSSETSREDRQLEASQQRLDKAREEGQLPRSRELAHLAAAGCLLALLLAGGPWLGQGALEIVGAGLRFSRDAAFQDRAMGLRLGELGLQAVVLIVPVAAGIAALLAGAAVSVGGWNFTTKALEPKFERLDPLAGFGRMFARHALLEHLRTIAVCTALLGIAGWWMLRHLGDLQDLGRMPLAAGLAEGFAWIATGLSMLAAVAIVAALLDAPLQIFKHKADLRMTQEEAKQEHKEAEGDPHLKGERRRRQRELSRGRMLAAVPSASVIVTNPTHYAVALRYEEGDTGAPVVVALGADHLALKIREVAAAARVPTLEAPPLARALYAHGEVGREVPVQLYTAVAQVLAWVFALRTARRTPAEPVIEVPAGMDPHEAKERAE